MQIRSTFSEGLEAELPSSLPFGYPYYATDTKRLFVGRGDDEAPSAISSDHEEALLKRVLKIEETASALRDELDIRLGQIGERDVDETEIGDGKLVYYDAYSDVYKFIDPINITGGLGGDSDDQQITLKNITATASKPHKVYIDIPYTVNFNRRPLEILKFLESQDNLISIAATYDNSEASQFVENKYVLFDGAMKPQTKYAEPMSILKGTDATAIHTSIPIDFDEFKIIEELSVSSDKAGDKIYTMIKTPDSHYSFIDNEWIDNQLTDPTGVEFVSKGMTDLRVVTTPTTNARFTLEKVKDEGTGSIFEATIDVNLFRKIQKIKVRQ